MSDKKPKKGLGRGLNALFPEYTGEVGDNVEGLMQLGVGEIRPNPMQPRQAMNEESIQELAQSISAHGVLQPLVVRSVEGGYELVAGERRWRAAREAGLTAVPALVKELSKEQVVEVALVENLQREDLNPLEEAEAYRTLLEEYGLTQEELSRRLGKSRSHITNTMRLQHLDMEVKENVSRGTLSMGHARALLGISQLEEQRRYCQQVLEEGLSVRETEELVRSQGANEGETSPGKKQASAVGKREKDPDLEALETRLQDNLGFRVQIKPGRRKGRLEIEYYTDRDLEVLCGMLGVNPRL